MAFNVIHTEHMAKHADLFDHLSTIKKSFAAH